MKSLFVTVDSYSVIYHLDKYWSVQIDTNARRFCLDHIREFVECYVFTLRIHRFNMPLNCYSSNIKQ